MELRNNAVKLAVALVAATPATASAQSGDSSDPVIGSPSGYVYEIPLERGRGDAAPGGTKRTRAGNTNRSAAPLKTEDNGFGSSSTVPGLTAAVQGGGGDAGGAGGKRAKEGGGEGAERHVDGRRAATKPPPTVRTSPL